MKVFINKNSFNYTVLYVLNYSVSDPYSMIPDRAKNLNPYPEPEYPWIRIQAVS